MWRDDIFAVPVSRNAIHFVLSNVLQKQNNAARKKLYSIAAPKHQISNGIKWTTSSRARTHSKPPAAVRVKPVFQDIAAAEEVEVPRRRRIARFGPDIITSCFKYRVQFHSPPLLLIYSYQLLARRHTPATSHHRAISHPLLSLWVIRIAIRSNHPFKVSSGISDYTLWRNHETNCLNTLRHYIPINCFWCWILQMHNQ